MHFRYYKLIIIHSLCTDVNFVEEDIESDTDVRCFSRSGYKDCLGSGHHSPPPPYEDPPSYEVALIMDQNENDFNNLTNS